MLKNPMGFQIPKTDTKLSSEAVHQRITAIPAPLNTEVHQSCKRACEAMNQSWNNQVEEVRGEWRCVEEKNHFSIFFEGRQLSSSELELMFLLVWQLLPRFLSGIDLT